MTPEEHRAICKDCPERKFYAKAFDMHFDWFDCWYDCENDYEHHQAEEAQRGEANEGTVHQDGTDPEGQTEILRRTCGNA